MPIYGRRRDRERSLGLDRVAGGCRRADGPFFGEGLPLPRNVVFSLAFVEDEPGYQSHDQEGFIPEKKEQPTGKIMYLTRLAT